MINMLFINILFWTAKFACFLNINLKKSIS